MPAPVVVFTYNRPLHTQRTLEALDANRGACETELFVFSDGARNDADAQRVSEVRALVRDYADKSRFRNVAVREAASNNGLANSVIAGVSEVIGQYGQAIVVEDDLISTPDFLEFMNGALDFYKEDQTVYSISGYTFPMKRLEKYPHDVYATFRGFSWGWGTWADRWQTVDWTVSDYAQFQCDRAMRRRFSRSGPDLPAMLDAQMAGTIDSWAVRWFYQQSKNNQLTIYPKQTRILNIGLDGSGTHKVNSDHWGTALPDALPPCKFEHLGVDKKLNRAFCYHFIFPFPMRVINKILRILRIPYQLSYD